MARKDREDPCTGFSVDVSLTGENAFFLEQYHRLEHRALVVNQLVHSVPQWDKDKHLLE